MSKKFYISLLLLLFITGCENHARRQANAYSKKCTKLQLVKIFTLQYPENFEASGLTFFGKHLLTVDDKCDQQIFEIIMTDTQARIQPFCKIKLQQQSGKLDLEGISCYQGNLYLASESRCNILKVTMRGQASWLDIDIKAYGRKHQMFQRRNAGIEGITIFNDGRILLAAEREPRGLIEIQTTPLSFRGYQLCQQTTEQMPNQVHPDFAGLCHHKGKLWALFRNKHQIVQLQGSIGKYRVVKRFSFAHILLDPRYRYSDMTYGLAEGLAIDDKHFYIVLDNNRMARVHAPNDRRPLLLILQKPN